MSKKKITLSTVSIFLLSASTLTALTFDYDKTKITNTENAILALYSDTLNRVVNQPLGRNLSSFSISALKNWRNSNLRYRINRNEVDIDSGINEQNTPSVLYEYMLNRNLYGIWSIKNRNIVDGNIYVYFPLTDTYIVKNIILDKLKNYKDSNSFKFAIGIDPSSSNKFSNFTTGTADYLYAGYNYDSEYYQLLYKAGNNRWYTIDDYTKLADYDPIKGFVVGNNSKKKLELFKTYWKLTAPKVKELPVKPIECVTGTYDILQQKCVGFTTAACDSGYVYVYDSATDTGKCIKADYRSKIKVQKKVQVTRQRYKYEYKEPLMNAVDSNSDLIKKILEKKGFSYKYIDEISYLLDVYLKKYTFNKPRKTLTQDWTSHVGSKTISDSYKKIDHYKTGQIKGTYECKAVPPPFSSYSCNCHATNNGINITGAVKYFSTDKTNEDCNITAQIIPVYVNKHYTLTNVKYCISGQYDSDAFLRQKAEDYEKGNSYSTGECTAYKTLINRSGYNGASYAEISYYVDGYSLIGIFCNNRFSNNCGNKTEKIYCDNSYSYYGVYRFHPTISFVSVNYNPNIEKGILCESISNIRNLSGSYKPSWWTGFVSASTFNTSFASNAVSYDELWTKFYEAYLLLDPTVPENRRGSIISADKVFIYDYKNPTYHNRQIPTGTRREKVTITQTGVSDGQLCTTTFDGIVYSSATSKPVGHSCKMVFKVDRVLTTYKTEQTFGCNSADGYKPVQASLLRNDPYNLDSSVINNLTLYIDPDTNQPKHADIVCVKKVSVYDCKPGYFLTSNNQCESKSTFVCPSGKIAYFTNAVSPYDSSKKIPVCLPDVLEKKDLACPSGYKKTSNGKCGKLVLENYTTEDIVFRYECPVGYQELSSFNSSIQLPNNVNDRLAIQQNKSNLNLCIKIDEKRPSCRNKYATVTDYPNNSLYKDATVDQNHRVDKHSHKSLKTDIFNKYNGLCYSEVAMKCARHDITWLSHRGYNFSECFNDDYFCRADNGNIPNPLTYNRVIDNVSYILSAEYIVRLSDGICSKAVYTCPANTGHLYGVSVSNKLFQKVDPIPASIDPVRGSMYGNITDLIEKLNRSAESSNSNENILKNDVVKPGEDGSVCVKLKLSNKHHNTISQQKNVNGLIVSDF